MHVQAEMSFPIAEIDECIDLAEQAPTGGNQSSRRWLVVTDPEIKAELGAIYRRASGNWMIEQAARLKGTGHHNERTMASAAYLAENIERVPLLVIVAIHGEHDGRGRPGLWPRKGSRCGPLPSAARPPTRSIRDGTATAGCTRWSRSSRPSMPGPTRL